MNDLIGIIVGFLVALFFFDKFKGGNYEKVIKNIRKTVKKDADSKSTDEMVDYLNSRCDIDGITGSEVKRRNKESN